MPCLALGLYPMCYIARLTRSSMLDALGQDYIKTARAKGLLTPRIIFKHALRNGVIPVITYLGPLTAFTLVGGFVVETVLTPFPAWAGLSGAVRAEPRLLHHHGHHHLPGDPGGHHEPGG